MQLSEILYNYTVDTLKKFAPLCNGDPYARKDDLVRSIHRALMKPDSLRQIWQRLDDLSQKAVAAAYHNDGEFNQTAFVAQYGSLPPRPQSRWSWSPEPILLDLFIHNNHLPTDLLPLLADLAPPPDRFQLVGVTQPPRVVKIGAYLVDLICAETEQAGPHDLLAYLRLVSRGQIKTSYTSNRATGASLKKLCNDLLNGDFLPIPENYRANKTIRPFGLDVFAYESGLVAQTRSRDELELTEAGRSYYQTQNPPILLEAFETWTQKGDFDELSRISALKGSGSRSTHLSPAAPRREAVIEALSWCPVGVWLNIRDFYRAVKIWHFDFQVETTQYSNLYVGYKEYGGLYGEDYWLITKGLYINAVLWEYLGALGALDLLYLSPEDADFETSQTTPYDTEPYFSLYDGLRYFRINPLGAYLLGQAGEYTPTMPMRASLFTISAALQVTLTQPDTLTPNDRDMLTQVALPLNGGRYCLDTGVFLTALETGAEFDYLAEFVRQRHHGPLPPEVSTWLERVRQHSMAFKKGDPALFIKVDAPELADLALADPALRSLCDRIDKRTLVIPARKEKAFRARLKELEYILQE